MARGCFYSDNPVKDFERYDSFQEEQLAKLPCCDRCGEPIQQEKAVYYNYQWICRGCETDFWLDIREDFLETVDDG